MELCVSISWTVLYMRLRIFFVSCSSPHGPQQVSGKSWTLVLTFRLGEFFHWTIFNAGWSGYLPVMCLARVYRVHVLAYQFCGYSYAEDKDQLLLETLHHIFVVNVGSAFKMIWKNLNYLLDTNTSAKVQISTSNYI